MTTRPERYVVNNECVRNNHDLEAASYILYITIKTNTADLGQNL